MSFFIGLKIQNVAVKKRITFYQDKIKKLLLRNDVGNCLVGKKVNTKSIDLEHEIQRIKQSAPQQIKALIQFYKNQHANHEQMIKKSMDEQNSRLSERIAKRSRSKSNSGSPMKSKLNEINFKIAMSLKYA